MSSFISFEGVASVNGFRCMHRLQLHQIIARLLFEKAGVEKAKTQERRGRRVNISRELIEREVWNSTGCVLRVPELLQAEDSTSFPIILSIHAFPAT